MSSRCFPPPWSVEELTPASSSEAVSWLNVQRHQAEVVSGVVDISDAHQFDNGVMRADRRFEVGRRNEVFVTVEAEVGYARTGKCVDRFILCHREARR